MCPGDFREGAIGGLTDRLVLNAGDCYNTRLLHLHIVIAQTSDHVLIAPVRSKGFPDGLGLEISSGGSTVHLLWEAAEVFRVKAIETKLDSATRWRIGGVMVQEAPLQAARDRVVCVVTTALKLPGMASSSVLKCLLLDSPHKWNDSAASAIVTPLCRKTLGFSPAHMRKPQKARLLKKAREELTGSLWTAFDAGGVSLVRCSEGAALDAGARAFTSWRLLPSILVSEEHTV